MRAHRGTLEINEPSIEVVDVVLVIVYAKGIRADPGPVIVAV